MSRPFVPLAKRDRSGGGRPSPQNGCSVPGFVRDGDGAVSHTAPLRQKACPAAPRSLQSLQSAASVSAFPIRWAESGSFLLSSAAPCHVPSALSAARGGQSLSFLAAVVGMCLFVFLVFAKYSIYLIQMAVHIIYFFPWGHFAKCVLSITFSLMLLWWDLTNFVMLHFHYHSLQNAHFSLDFFFKQLVI